MIAETMIDISFPSRQSGKSCDVTRWGERYTVSESTPGHSYIWRSRKAEGGPADEGVPPWLLNVSGSTEDKGEGIDAWEPSQPLTPGDVLETESGERLLIVGAGDSGDNPAPDSKSDLLAITRLFCR